MEKKFGIPFSGAADELTSAGDDAAKGDLFPSDQVDESRKGAMHGDAKFAKDVGCEMMQSTGKAETGFSPWKKMESF